MRRVLAKGGAAAWDLVGWALEDEDVETRRQAARCLVPLAHKEQRIATILAERAILDSDTNVMVSAIKCIEVLDTDHGRAKDLVLAGCTHKNTSVRLACVKILPRLMGDEILRNHCNALLRERKTKGFERSCKKWPLMLKSKVLKRKRMPSWHRLQRFQKSMSKLQNLKVKPLDWKNFHHLKRIQRPHDMVKRGCRSANRSRSTTHV